MSRSSLPKILELQCLADGLVQVLVSLAHNALHASSATDVPVTLSAHAAGEAVRFVVADRGVGIPADVLDRVGEPFFTTKAPGEGMGLGLFLARAFVERCRGVIRLVSEEGSGTDVVLELPRTMERALEQ